MIKPEEKQQFQEEILIALRDNNRSYGLPGIALSRFTELRGFKPTTDETTAALEYLTDKELAVEAAKIIGQGNRNFKITEKGRQYLDEHNL